MAMSTWLRPTRRTRSTDAAPGRVSGWSGRGRRPLAWTGGTVAVFGTLEALARHIPDIAVEYSRRIGVLPEVFEGTSPGAVEFGARRYAFGATGWQRFKV